MNRLKRPDYLETGSSGKRTNRSSRLSPVYAVAVNLHFLTSTEITCLNTRIRPEQIISINFEDLEFEELSDYRSLYQYVKERLCPDRMNYIFLDEIQHVESYQKAVDSLFLRENCDVYITGSNA